MKHLPPWIAADSETLRKENRPVLDTYHRAYSGGQRRLATPGELDKVESAAYYLGHMVKEHIAPCAATLARQRTQRKPHGGHKVEESYLWLGWIPHQLAAGVGWRMRPACEIFARHGHPSMVDDFHQWADSFLIRAQCILDSHNALGRQVSRTGDAAVPLMAMLIDDARIGLDQIVNILRLDPKTSRLLNGEDADCS